MDNDQRFAQVHDAIKISGFYLDRVSNDIGIHRLLAPNPPYHSTPNTN